MNNSSIRYTLLLVLLGIVSFFTGEVVTFVLLGFIVIILTNIHDVLKKILAKLNETSR